MWIRNKEITQDKLFIISEVGNQFGGSVEKAKRLIDVTKEAGADAVKFIFWFPDEILADKSIIYEYETNFVHPNYPNTKPVKTKVAELMFGLLDKLRLTDGEWREVRDYALNKDVIFMSTIISPGGIDLENFILMDAIKISSWDYNFPDLWRWIAWQGKPMLIDLGPADEELLAKNLSILKSEYNTNYALLHCFHTQNYNEMNMLTIPYLREKFKCPVGYSSIDYNDETDIMAVALGACILEKRLTLDRKGGILHDSISKEPDEFKAYVEKMRQCKEAMGKMGVFPSPNDIEQSKKWFRRIVADVDIRKGETITRDMLEAKRGRTGIEPERIWEFVGRRASQNIPRNTTLTEEMARAEADN